MMLIGSIKNPRHVCSLFFFFNDTATTDIYTLSLHDALPISSPPSSVSMSRTAITCASPSFSKRSEEHTSEFQSLRHLVCRLLVEKNTTTQRWKRVTGYVRPSRSWCRSPDTL